jgi:amino acid transporter
MHKIKTNPFRRKRFPKNGLYPLKGAIFYGIYIVEKRSGISGWLWLVAHVPSVRALKLSG